MKKIILLSLFLTVISFSVITFFGNTYTVVFKIDSNTNNANNNLSIEEETGKIEVLKKQEKDGSYIVKVKSKKPGVVNLYFDYGGFQTGERLYIHKNMVITGNTYIGKSTCSEVVPISLSIILLYTLFLLVKTYKQRVKENIYQYSKLTILCQDYF